MQTQVRADGILSVVLPRHPWVDFVSNLNDPEAKHLGQKMNHLEYDRGLLKRRFFAPSSSAIQLVPSEGRPGSFMVAPTSSGSNERHGKKIEWQKDRRLSQ